MQNTYPPPSFFQQSLTMENEVAHIISSYLANLAAPLATAPFSVVAVYTHIAQNLFETEIRVNELLEELHIKDHNFTTQFKRYTGFTIKQFIVFHRMEVAAQLLCNTHLKPCDISAIVQMEKSAFYKVFKAHFKELPLDYRKNHFSEENQEKS